MNPRNDDPWHASWEAMYALAWWHLNRSLELCPLEVEGRPFHCDQRLRLWDDARGFGCGSEPMTLTVFEPAASAGKNPVVRKASWNRSPDLDRLHKSVRLANQVVASKPTFLVQDALVPPDPWAALLDEAAGFRVPVVWGSGGWTRYMDVGSRGFEFFTNDSPPAVLRLEWSMEVPTSWEPVVAWVARVRKFLEACLPDKDHPPSPIRGGTHPLWDSEVDGGTA
jgi:hypothetical protein